MATLNNNSSKPYYFTWSFIIAILICTVYGLILPFIMLIIWAFIIPDTVVPLLLGNLGVLELPFRFVLLSGSVLLYPISYFFAVYKMIKLKRFSVFLSFPIINLFWIFFLFIISMGHH